VGDIITKGQPVWKRTWFGYLEAVLRI